MQAHQPLPPPIHRGQDNYSPSSAAGSEWSGMNNYTPNLRPEYGQPSRGQSISPPDADFEPRPPHRAQTYAAGSPTEHPDQRGSFGQGSRTSSRAASSRASDISLRDPRSQRYQRAESELRQHYAVLRAYLKGGASQPPRTNKARDKLLRLSPVQFHELSTDVFDELQRRQAAQPLPGKPPRQDKVPPFLQPRQDFHEKRNQARQKLSSLQTSRFRDLSTDVFCELERRFPHFSPDRPDAPRSMSRGPGGRPPPSGAPGPNGFGPPPRAHTTQASMSSNAGFPPRKGSMAPPEVMANGNELGRPMPKQFQSNTITPNKSTMVEDDDDDGGPMGHYDRSSDAFGLESSLTSPRGSRRDTSATSMTGGSKSTNPPAEELQSKISELEQEVKRLSSVATLRDELQSRLEQAQDLNRNMQEEIDKLRQSQSEGGGEWKQKHVELAKQHTTLRSQYEQQMTVTEEVKKQFQTHMADIRALADENSTSMQREESLHTEVQKLREEAAEWRARYTNAKTKLSSTRLSTIDLNAMSAKGLRDKTFFSTDGWVKDVHVTKFQLSIDELLGIARTQEPSTVLDYIKELVTAVRMITGDVETLNQDMKEDISRRNKKLLAKISTTANNVITASKNFAAAHGLSPVSLLDAAASHLTSAVVELLRVVKIRPTSETDGNQQPEPNMTPVNQNGYFVVLEHTRKVSEVNSIYSALSDPPEHEIQTPVAPTHDATSVNGHAFAGLGINSAQLQQDDAELEELKIYLGNQTDVLVQNIQALVGSVRNEESLINTRNHANGILDVVDIILAAVEGGMEQPTSFQQTMTMIAEGGYNNLSKSKDQLEHAVHESIKHDNKPSARQFSQSLPPLAFQIAREAKELTGNIEGVMTQDNEDFS